MSASSAPAAVRTFLLPDLGEGLSEAEVIDWLVAPGDEVKVDQIVVTVETAKASVDLPCPYAGSVLSLDAEPGAVLEVGKALLTIDAAPPGQGAPKSGSGSVLVGYGTSQAKRSGRSRVNPTRKAARSIPREPLAPRLATKVISPVVRKLATDNKINVAALAPSGPFQVIRRADVEAALRASHARSGADEPAAALSQIRTDRAGDLRIPLRGVRRTIADKMTRSRAEIPEASTWVDVDATALLAAKDQIKAVSPSMGIALMALMARISIAGLTKFPELNARVDVEAQEIVQLGDINLSFAAASPRGLMVPVVHGAGAMTTAELAAALRELTGLARAGKLTRAQMSDGTFTLNNYGVFGTDGATPIINYPQAAMLGVGRIIDRPWAYEGQVALRKVTQLGLTFDHRVCDGATAGGFLRFVADCVEQPVLLLADL